MYLTRLRGEHADEVYGFLRETKLQPTKSPLRSPEMTDFLRNSSFSPGVVCVVCFAASYLFSTHRWKLPWRILSIALTVVLLVAAAAYLVLPVLAEDTETDIAAIAAVVMHGGPMYPAPDSAACYILLYGPLTYLAHVPFYIAFGASLFSFKLLGFLSFLATLLALYGIARAFARTDVSLIGCAAAGVVLLRFLPVPFWGRIDSLILGIVALAYWVSSTCTGECCCCEYGISDRGCHGS